MHWGWYGGGGWWVMLLMTGLWLGVILLVALAAVGFGRSLFTGPGHPQPPAAGAPAAGPPWETSRETPREILDRRFASGEIDEETYRRTRDQLAGQGPPHA